MGSLQSSLATTDGKHNEQAPDKSCTSRTIRKLSGEASCKEGNKEDYGILKEINVEQDYWDEQFEPAAVKVQAEATRSNYKNSINQYQINQNKLQDEKR